MPPRMLPREIRSLIHHVELNKLGWWNKTIQRLITATIWMASNDHAASLESLVQNLQANFEVTLSPSKVEAEIDVMCHNGELLRLPDARFKIPEHIVKKLTEDISRAEEEDTQAQLAFVSLLPARSAALDPEDVWNKFNDQLLLPWIFEAGATTYRLITGGNTHITRSTKFDTFLKSFPQSLQGHVRAAIEAFIDPKSPAIRSYILRSLTAALSIEAASLNPKNLKSITRSLQNKPSMVIFVDTNFLFSILGLHDNPANEAALSFIELAESLEGTINVKLYVLPPTVEETRAVLKIKAEDFGELRVTPSMAKAALAVEGVTGVIATFLHNVIKADQPLLAKDFFDPYQMNLIRIFRARNVELYSAKLDNYNVRQDVLDAILERQAFEQKKFGSRAKKYEELRHDMVLWHFARDMRPPVVESPLEAKYWIVTVDYRFLGFDDFARRQRGDPFPLCLHPSILTQMLGFWVPRTAQLEEAIVSSMRLPFLFRDFDVEAERVTMRILERLGRLENVDDIPIEAISGMLVDEALRQKIRSETDLERQGSLVKEALAEELRRLKETLDVAINKSAELETALGFRERALEKAEVAIKEKDRAIQGLEAEAGAIRDERRQLEERIDKAEEAIKTKYRARQNRSRRLVFVTEWCCLIVIALGGTLVLSAQVAGMWSGLGFWRLSGILSSMVLIMGIWLIELVGRRDEVVRSWEPFVVFGRFKRWLFGGLLIAILYGVLGNAAWEAVRSSL